MTIQSTLPPKFTPLIEWASNAHLIAWDGCHKIYLAMDEEQAEWFRENYEIVMDSSLDAMLWKLVDWYDKSCFLRFISAVATNHDDPNAGYTTLIAQFDEDEDEE